MYVNNLVTGSSPLIIHAPGLHHSRKKDFIHMATNPYWVPILRNWENKSSALRGKNHRDDLTIITWNSTDIKGYCEQSLEKLGWDYLCLARNITPWRFIDKMNTALQMMDSIKTPYVMALDSFDVIVLRDPSEAVEKFKKMNCDMLINGEKNYHPDFGIMTTGRYAVTDQWKKYEMSLTKSPWKFLNSGALISKTGFYKECLTKCLERHEAVKENPDKFCLPRDPVFKKYPDYKVGNDDQMLFHWLFFDYYPQIMIDYDMNIFFNAVHTALDRKKLIIEDDVFTGLGRFQYGMAVKFLGILLKGYRAFNKAMVVPSIIKNFLKERESDS
ncbi:MAG: hypothetical protein QMD11_02415 [Smithella sp.]|nr:hypothetical protein [Smithella sp.]